MLSMRFDEHVMQEDDFWGEQVEEEVEWGTMKMNL